MNNNKIYLSHSENACYNEPPFSFDEFNLSDCMCNAYPEAKHKKRKKRKEKKKVKKLIKLMKKEGYSFSCDKTKKRKKKKLHKEYSSNPWETLLATCMPKLIEVCGDCAKEYLKSKNEKN